MSMRIKDYLHLYLGCEVLRPDGKTILRMVGISGNIIEFENPYGTHEMYGDALQAKPILRPLSDMTEEELREVRYLMIEYSDLSFTHERMHNNLVGNGKSFYYSEFSDEGNFLCAVTSSIQNLPLKVIPFLLSKHFDLFGLIKAGLAIDKTEIAKL